MRMIKGRQARKNLKFSEAEALADIAHMPARKCAVLGWRTMEKILKKIAGNSLE